MQTKLTIPERLKDLRVEHGLTLEQLAAKTGLSAAALGRYEIDDGTKAARSVDISSYALCQLAEVYGVSIDYLLGRTENKNPTNTEVQALQRSGQPTGKTGEGIPCGSVHRLRCSYQRGICDADRDIAGSGHKPDPPHGHGKGKKRR